MACSSFYLCVSDVDCGGICLAVWVYHDMFHIVRNIYRKYNRAEVRHIRWSKVDIWPIYTPRYTFIHLATTQLTRNFRYRNSFVITLLIY